MDELLLLSSFFGVRGHQYLTHRWSTAFTAFTAFTRVFVLQGLLMRLIYVRVEVVYWFRHSLTVASVDPGCSLSATLIAV